MLATIGGFAFGLILGILFGFKEAGTFHDKRLAEFRRNQAASEEEQIQALVDCGLISKKKAKTYLDSK